MFNFIAKKLINLYKKENKNVFDKIASFFVREYMINRDRFYTSKNFSRVFLKARHIKRMAVNGKIDFVSFEDSFIWTLSWIKQFPVRYDIVVGIPRSGLFIANIIALKLGIPLATTDNLLFGKKWKSKYIGDGKCRRILLVDDSVDSGESMRVDYNKLKNRFGDCKITKAALIVTPKSKKSVDLFFKSIPQPRLFEWNLLHSKKGSLAVDLDGVLCENPKNNLEADEKKYVKWIKNAKPYLIPAFEVDVIVSCRLEKYRAETKKWLKKNGVKYKELILWDLPSRKERQGMHISYKVKNIINYKPDYFWESSFHEAEGIYSKTKIPTLCVDEMIFFS